MISQTELHELLDYDPATGLFTWKQVRAGRCRAGAVAGGIDRLGYRRIRLGERLYSAARLAWLHVHGTWPPDQIDHVNRCRSDDRLDNLRAATRSQNAANRASWAQSGFKGVKKNKGKWEAATKIGGKDVYLGLYSTKEEVNAAYFAKAKEVFGEFASAS